jgi:Holliday junction resolvasome RuvABC endonuclease subunit
MTTVMGLDPSVASTGLVTWRDGKFYATTIATAPGLKPAMRHDMVVMRILSMVDPDGPDRTFVAMEGRINPGDGSGRADTALDLAELRGVINYGLHVRGVSKVDIHPATLKVYATGNGHASKAAMTVAARGRLGEHLYCANDDESDAAWLLAMAMHHYGRPLCPLPKKHTAAIAKPAWPPFTLEG